MNRYPLYALSAFLSIASACALAQETPAEQDPTAPTFDQVMNQITEDRVNLRARRYLRDLRRDAVIEFR